MLELTLVSVLQLSQVWVQDHHRLPLQVQQQQWPLLHLMPHRQKKKQQMPC